MERRGRLVWWGLLAVMIMVATWQLFLPHGNKVTVEKASTGREIVVYVTGAVSKPGLVHLPLDARLDDALKQASLLPEANLEVLNPAEKLKDGQKISVPYKPVAAVPAAGAVGGISGGTTVGSYPVSGGSNGAPSTAATTGGQAAGGGNPAVSGAGKININSASAAELDKLPGIGPALAERIIQYRTENGPFVRPEDLQEVSGIGPKTYEKMAAMVSVGP